MKIYKSIMRIILGLDSSCNDKQDRCYIPNVWFFQCTIKLKPLVYIPIFCLMSFIELQDLLKGNGLLFLFIDGCMNREGVTNNKSWCWYIERKWTRTLIRYSECKAFPYLQRIEESILSITVNVDAVDGFINDKTGGCLSSLLPQWAHIFSHSFIYC